MELEKMKNEMDENMRQKISEQTVGQFGVSMLFNDEFVMISNNEFEAISDIANHYTDIELVECNCPECRYKLNMSFDDVTEDSEYNDMIKILFAVHRDMEAWKYIKNDMDRINFNDLSQFEYFKLKRDEFEVFDYMYDKSVIGDYDYARLLSLSGTIHNIEFWKKYFESNNADTFTKMLDMMNESFGELNPLDIGLIEIDDNFRTFMFDVITEDDKLDKYIIEKPCVLFTVNDLKRLILNKNFDDTNYALYVISQYFDESTTDEEYKDYFNFVCDHSTDISKFFIDNENIFRAAIDAMVDISEDNAFEFTEMIMNSDIFPYYINTIKRKVTSLTLAGDERYNYLISILSDNEPIMVSDLQMKNISILNIAGINTSNYITIPSVKFMGYIVYNKLNNRLLYANKVYDYGEFRLSIRIFDEFKEDPDYKYHEISDTEKQYLDACKSEFEFKEFMYSVIDLFNKIDAYAMENYPLSYNGTWRESLRETDD